MPQLTLCHNITPSNDLRYTVDHNFSYCSRYFIPGCVESSSHAHSMQSEVELLENCETRKVMDILSLCHKVPYKPWTVVDGQRL